MANTILALYDWETKYMTDLLILALANNMIEK